MNELKGVTKQYLYGARLFGTLDLTVADGEKLAILGGEKSGKTTFLKMLAGIEKCEGEILFDGKPINIKTDDIIMMFDDGAVFENKTVFDNLAYPLKLRKVNNREILDAVFGVAKDLGIVACLNMRARQLSPLERRKMSVARLFIRKAKLLLIDELTSGLSAKDARDLFEDVSKLIGDRCKSASVVYATSEPSEAIALGDRIMVLAAREIKQIGTAQDIWKMPDSIWSAQAIDRDYNFLKGILSAENDKVNIAFNLGCTQPKIDITEIAGRILPEYIGREVYVGFHPNEVKDGGIHEDVKYVRGAICGYMLETQSGVKIASTDKKEFVDYAPELSSLTLFDATTENSIMRR